MDRSTFEGREIAVLFAQQRRKTPEEMRETPSSYVSYMSYSVESVIISPVLFVPVIAHANRALVQILAEGSLIDERFIL